MDSSANQITWKEQKEAFVTSHEGTTSWEVLLVCLSAPMGLACYRHLVRLIQPTTKTSQILLEALLVWFPMVLCQTNFLYPWGVSLLVLEGVLVALSSIYYSEPDERQNSILKSTKPTKLDFLTAYRSTILYLTFIAILAVDFHVFPRRFAKTEVKGYGLMDVGAASFCLSAGLVSKKARVGHGNHKAANNNLRQLLHTLPLVVLGLLRIWTNKELEYQEHVSEYGVHWNFFFTMGVLAVVPPLVPFGRATWILPASILLLYQSALSLWGMQEYIENAPRICTKGHDDTLCLPFFAANREGVLGCFGYLSLYFMGEYVGAKFVWKGEGRQSLWTLSVSLWTLALGSSNFLPVSRRSTNAAFCIWAAAHNVLILTTFQQTIKIGVQNSIPIVFETVNRHGLVMFLVANLLTGLVNLTIPTLTVSDGPALMIVFSYICLVGIVALLFDALLIRLLLSKKKVN